MLIPFYVDEALPGDTFKARASLFARLATPIKPIMDNLFMETFYFAVPNRLVWENWQRFCGERTDPNDSTDYIVPQIDFEDGPVGEGSLYDYMGMPIGVNNLSTLRICPVMVLEILAIIFVIGSGNLILTVLMVLFVLS